MTGAPDHPVALVTGAAGGLGSVIASDLHSRGWRVVGVDKLPIVCPATDAERFTALTIDLAAEGAAGRMAQDADKAFGGIDLLVNAIGYIHSEPVLSFRAGRLIPHAEDKWREVIEANLTRPFLAAAAVAGLMARRRRQGVIVNVSSVSARGNEGQAAYAAAKAGLEAATKVMARELGPLGIRVNAVAPGFIDTPSSHAALSTERLDKLIQATPLRRLGTPDEVARAVEACWTNTFMTGAIIAVDGGILV